MASPDTALAGWEHIHLISSGRLSRLVRDRRRATALATEDGLGYQAADHRTPEATSERKWAHELIQETLGALGEGRQNTDKETHFELFRRRICGFAASGGHHESIGFH